MAKEKITNDTLEEADVNKDGIVDAAEMVGDGEIVLDPSLPVITLDKITNDFGREDLNEMRDKLNLVLGFASENAYRSDLSNTSDATYLRGVNNL